MKDCDERDRAERKCCEDKRVAEVQRCRRNHHGREKHQRKRIFYAAGQIKQCTELENVKAQEERRVAVGQPVRGRKADRQQRIERRARKDGDQAADEWQAVIESEVHDEKGR